MRIHPVIILLGAALCGAGIALAIKAAIKTHPPAVVEKDEPKAAVPLHVVLNYTAPPGRCEEMQGFDKAALFLAACQEEDGHWSPAKSGASKEFSGPNDEITLTALATYVLLSTAQGKNQDPVATAHARKGLDWLLARVKPDGQVAEIAPGGTIAQLFTTMSLLQACGMTTRESMKKTANSVAQYAVHKMHSVEGFADTPGGKDVRADVTALATWIWRSSMMEEIHFGAKREDEDFVEKRFRNGFRLLDSDPKKIGGIYCVSALHPGPDWDATVAGIFGQVLLMTAQKDIKHGLNYIFGEYDAKSGRFSKIDEKFRWGKGGKGFRALTVWYGTVMSVYVFTDGKPEFKTWMDAVKTEVLRHQSDDGGWEAAGDDAPRGRVWCTALNALTMVIAAPAPPPPSAPPQ